MPGLSPVASGLRTRSRLSVSLRIVAGFEPKLTVALERLVPVIVTSVPPTTDPDVLSCVLMLGGPSYVN